MCGNMPLHLSKAESIMSMVFQNLIYFFTPFSGNFKISMHVIMQNNSYISKLHSVLCIQSLQCIICVEHKVGCCRMHDQFHRQ